MSRRHRSVFRVVKATALVAGCGLLTLSVPARLWASPSPRMNTMERAGCGSVGELPERWQPVARVLGAEQSRALRQLKVPGRSAPYFLAHSVIDISSQRFEARWGQLSHKAERVERRLKVEVRVGEPQLDNSHYTLETDGFQLVEQELAQVPLGEQTEALARSVWVLTDRAYRVASDTLEGKSAARASAARTEALPPDFSPVEESPPVAPRSSSDRVAAAPPLLSSELQDAARQASALFLDSPIIRDGGVLVSAYQTERLLRTTERRVCFEPLQVLQIELFAEAQAADGTPLQRTHVFHQPIAARELVDAARRLVDSLQALTRAPVVPFYSGPVLFEREAGAQLLMDTVSEAVVGTETEQFGPERVWARKLGKRVLPRGMRLTDDPRAASFNGTPLLGHYLLDDEGVAPRPVEIVSGDGRLRALLMSRKPSLVQKHSNGHGRTGLSEWAVGAVGSLFLETDRGLSAAALRHRLLRAVRDEGAEYGLIVRRLAPRDGASGGHSPPKPELIYRAFVDGRVELVRGLEFGAIPPREFKHLLAAGKELHVHNVLRQTGALPIPTSVAAPGLLFEELDLRVPESGHELPPVLPLAGSAEGR